MGNDNEKMIEVQPKSSVETAQKYSETHGTGVLSSIMFVVISVVIMASLASYIH